MKRFIALIVVLMTVGVSAQELPRAAFITFVSSSAPDNNEDIFVIDTNGSNLYNLTVNPARDWHPDWSPDGRQIVFVSNRTGSADLYVMDANGANLVPRTTTPDQNEGAPSWSPDGERIAFIVEKDGATDLYMLTREGSEPPVRLTNDGISKGAPTWSPDGRQVAFWRAAAQDRVELVSLDRVSLNETVILGDGVNNWPAYAPNGQALAFFRIENGLSRLYALDFSSDAIIPLSDVLPERSDLQPAWSPDGAQLAFTSDRDGQLSIYTQVAFGGVTGFGAFPKRLVPLDANAHSPAWQPQPVVIDFASGDALSMGLSYRISDIGNVENPEVDTGRLDIFAPQQMGIRDVVTIRLELRSRELLARESGAALPAPLAQFTRDAMPIYRYMGAELQGFDIGAFDILPNPSGYLIEVDPNEVNFWEWRLRPRDPSAVGRRDLLAVVYLPPNTRNGVSGQEILLEQDFSIEIVRDQTVIEPTLTPAVVTQAAANAAPRLGDGDIPRLRIVYSQGDLFSIIVLDRVDLSGVAIASGRSEYRLTDMFDALSLMGNIADPNMCFHFVRSEAEAPLPLDCVSREVNLRRPLIDYDVFWFDFDTVSPLFTVFRVVDLQRTEYCAATEQTGCEV